MESIAVPHAGVDHAGAKPLDGCARRDPLRRTSRSATGARTRRPSSSRLNLTIRPGERVGIVGRSGAGKSTLVNLVLRFHEPEAGRILIDGQDIARVTQESLRGAIGMVTQDTSLLHRSIAANIRYGTAERERRRGLAAARKAQAHEFILGLRDWNGRTGYEAHVGERGVKLSGGQRQRIALARVILKDAPILVLDEATSALDSEVEVAIQEQLITLMEGQNRDRDRAPAVDDRAHGSARRARPRPDRRGGHAHGAACAAAATTRSSGATSRAGSSRTSSTRTRSGPLRSRPEPRVGHRDPPSLNNASSTTTKWSSRGPPRATLAHPQ